MALDTASQPKLTPAQCKALLKIAANRTWGMGSWKDAARASRPVDLPRLKIRIASARALEAKGLVSISTQDAGAGRGNSAAAVTLTEKGLSTALGISC